MNEYPFGNIIDVDEPLSYNCRVWGYVPGHSQLLIRLYKEDLLDASLYLGFETVIYFEGPMNWVGVDFQLGQPDECKILLKKIGINVPDIAIEEFLRLHRLFIINRPEGQIRIFAGNVHLVKEIPKMFRNGPKG